MPSINNIIKLKNVLALFRKYLYLFSKISKTLYLLLTFTMPCKARVAFQVQTLILLAFSQTIILNL